MVNTPDIQSWEEPDSLRSPVGWTDEQIDLAESYADAGNFSLAAMLCDDMLADDRVFSATRTLRDSVLGAPLTFDGKSRPVKALETQEDYWKIFEAAEASRNFFWGFFLGVSLTQRVWKKIGSREIKLASLYILTTPTLVLLGTALSFAIPAVRADVEETSIWNPGLHGFGEVLYAFTSAANNNGSAFAGLTANTPWFNTALGVAMMLGRFLPIVFVLALAGSLAAQDKVPVTAGTLPTHRPQFVGLLLGVVVIVSALTYFPVLALGPLAEGLQ